MRRRHLRNLQRPSLRTNTKRSLKASLLLGTNMQSAQRVAGKDRARAVERTLYASREASLRQRRNRYNEGQHHDKNTQTANTLTERYRQSLFVARAKHMMFACWIGPNASKWNTWKIRSAAPGYSVGRGFLCERSLRTWNLVLRSISFW